MAYKFNVDGETFTSRTVPGSAYMRILHDASNQFIAAFVPETDTLLGIAPTGKWVDILPSTKPEWLEKLEPNVLEACRKRRFGFAISNMGLPKDSHVILVNTANNKLTVIATS